MATKFKSAKQLRVMITGANPTSTLQTGFGLIYSDCWESVPFICFSSVCVCVCVCVYIYIYTPQVAYIYIYYIFFIHSTIDGHLG